MTPENPNQRVEQTQTLPEKKLKNSASKIWDNLIWAWKENPILAWMMALTLYFWPWFSSKESLDMKFKKIFKK